MAVLHLVLVKMGFGVGEQEWQAQPNIPPEPNPNGSLLPFCPHRKEVASADAKISPIVSLVTFCFFTESNNALTPRRRRKTIASRPDDKQKEAASFDAASFVCH